VLLPGYKLKLLSFTTATDEKETVRRALDLTDKCVDYYFYFIFIVDVCIVILILLFLLFNYCVNDSYLYNIISLYYCEQQQHEKI
jgi:hypothetical protein